MTEGLIAIVWEFVVPPQNRARFEEAYGPEGEWATLFRRSSDFIGTELLRDREREGIYWTIDRWSSAAAFERFKREFGADYEALDISLEGLASRETRLGLFEAR